MDREAWWTAVYGVTKSRTRLSNWTELTFWGFPGGSVLKNPPAVQELQETRVWSGSRRSPGGRHGNWLQYACLDHPHGQRRVAGLQFMGSQSQTQLKWLCMQTHLDFLKGKGKRVKLTINIIGVPIDFPALPRDSCVLRQCSNPPYWGLQSLLCSLERISKLVSVLSTLLTITFIHLNISCTEF